MPLLYVQEEQQAPAGQRSDVPKFYERVPPLRTVVLGGEPAEAMFTEEPTHDSTRVEFARGLWHGQDHMLRGRDRQVEENIRMLCGQHWSIWNELLGKHVDLTKYMGDEERRWRQMPVMNRLLLWFMLLHARMTENPPIIAFQPATSDRIDAELAEVMSTVWKTVWHQADMSDVIDDLCAWMIPGGRAYTKSRIDPDAGDLVPIMDAGVLQLVDVFGQPIMGPNGPIQRYLEKAPYTRQGEPMKLTMLEDGSMSIPMPEMEREGGIVCEALGPLEVRSEWGRGKFRRKNWHIHRTYCTPEELYRSFGVELDPEVFGDEADQIAELQRLQFGAGYYGQAGGREEISGQSSAGKEGFIEVFESWFRPCGLPGMESTEENPGGRLLITTRSKVLRDGPRYAPFPNTSPIHAFDFVNVPGRPQGTSPQEMMNGPARSRNRLFGQIFAHTDKVANPITLVDSSTGLQKGDVPNRPGAQVFGNFQGQTGDPIRYTRPPDLGRDVYNLAEMLKTEMDDLGNLPGGDGRAPTSDASGELVKELRFNSDRFVAPTARRMVTGFARMSDDWRVMIPLIWTQEKLLRVGGDEKVAQTLTVTPEIFKLGRVDAVPDLESMLPEGRGEREQRFWNWYQSGVLGQPGTPEANSLYLDLSHFPHLNREALPGGIDRSTASLENGQIMQGAMPPVLQWYDHAVHLFIHYRFMKSQSYLKLPIPIQEMFVQHVAEHEEAAAAQLMQQVAQQMAMQQQIEGEAPQTDQPANGEQPNPSAAPAA